MKKILLACAAVTLVAVAQAASINWTISNVYQSGNTSEKISAGSYTAYLFVTENTTDVSLKTTSMAAVQAILGSEDLTGLANLAAVSKTNTGLGVWAGATGLTGFSSGALSAFAVIIDSTDLASAEHYLLVSNGTEKSVTFSSASGAKVLAFGDQTALTQGDGWQAVPEPTTGLLLLIGMAGLALRRKQA